MYSCKLQLDLQCLELRVAGGVLRGLDDDIVCNSDVREVLGNAVSTLQCVELRDSEICKERRIIGTKTEVDICVWSDVTKLQPREMDREYAPLELNESELWIADLFEPIRSKLFAPPQCKEEVMFFLSDETVPNDATCAYLCAAHPKLHGAWFQVMLTKDLATVDVFLCDNYGGQYWPSCIYTSNRIFSSFSLDPDTKDRKVAWETWGRHEAAHEKFADYCKELDPGTNSGFGQSCTLIRSISLLTGGGEKKRRELFIPRRFLSGLIPQGLVNSYIFWQDVETPAIIRGYQEEKEGSWVDMKAGFITIDLKRMDEDEHEANQGGCESLFIEGKSVYNSKYLCDVRLVLIKSGTTTALVYYEINGNGSLCDLQDPGASRLYVDNVAQKQVKDTRTSATPTRIKGVLEYEVSISVGQKLEFEFGSSGYSRMGDVYKDSYHVLSLEMRKIFRQRCEDALKKISAAVILHPKTSPLLKNDIFSPCEDGHMPLSALKAGVMALQLTISEPDLLVLFDFLKARGSEGVSKKNWLHAIAGADWESELRAQGLDMEKTRANVVARGIDIDRLHAYRAEVQMKKKDRVIRATGMPGVCAKVSLTKSPKSRESNEKEVLLNALQAPSGSALWSLIRTISRVEHASHVLVWGVPAESSEHRITRVELTRLKASFSVRKHTGLDDTRRMLLFSDDLPGFYIIDFNELPVQAKELVQGVPQLLILCSLQNEWLVMVPNTKAVRPQVGPRPFSCEIVFDHDDAKWKEHSEVEYFTYQLHPSGLSLVPKGLASGFYLLVLKFLGRDYHQACAMVSSISTDAALSKQEEQVLALLSQTASDQHPDALACRVKIELALVDCPINLPWDIRQVAGLYFTKLRHVSAGVRLSEREEYLLIRLCKETTKIQKIIANGAARYSKESVQEWCAILCNPQYRKEAGSAKGIQDAEAFSTSLLDMVYAKGQHLDRTKLLFFLQNIGNQVSLVWSSVLNREKYLDAKNKNEYSAQACFPARRRTSAWQIYNSTRIMNAKPKDFDGLAVRYRMSEKNIRGVDAIQMVIDLFEHGESTADQFMLIYDIFSQRIKVKLHDSPQHTFAGLLFYFAISDCRGGSLFASILSTMYHNPHIFSGPDSTCPKLDDDRINYDSSIFRTDPTANEPRVPLRVLLESFVTFIQAQASNLQQIEAYKVPTTAMKCARIVSITNEVKLLDECPPCQVADFQIPSRVVCGHTAWVEIFLGKQDIEQQLLASYDEQVLEERPLLATTMEYVVEKKRRVPSKTAPFDVDTLLKGSSGVEKAMIDRLQSDFALLHTMAQSKDGVTYQLMALAGKENALARGSMEEIDGALANIMELSRKLQKLKGADMKFFGKVQTLVVEIANGQCTQSNAEEGLVLQLKLLRISGHRPLMTFPFLLLTLLSSQKDEWKQINPFISPSCISAASDLLCIALLHAIRASSTNLALAQLHSLRTELEKLKNLGPKQVKDDPAVKNSEIVLKQMSSALGDLLGARRIYLSTNRKGAETLREFKPHFLVFEFQSSMMLRVRQVEIVKEICDAMENPKDGQRAVVKQMIMGSGKTTVVSPLLALLLADSKSLVLQVMPPALLDFSRGVMRQALSDSVGKRVCTLLFERNDSVDARLLSKLKNAAASGAVVVTTPSSLKSMMLKTIENMLGMRDPGNPKRKVLQRQIKEASKLFSLLKDAIIIMDEVDMILHPLKSELNFPIGPKEPLPDSPMRWKFPIYLLSFFLKAGKDVGAQTYDALTERQVEIIYKMREVLNNGANDGSVQRRPHWVLVSAKFYTNKLLPLFVDLSLLYCDKSGIDSTQSWVRLYLDAEKVSTKSEEARAFLNSSEQDRGRLNMIRVWLHLVLPHILQKVDRVSFGLMNEQDCQRALKSDPRMPRSRLHLAIPFVGKDAPSTASEFAHPDVTLGLSILAYRYEGLRLEHIKDILRSLKANLSREIGPPEKRPSAIMFQTWISQAGGIIVQCLGKDKTQLEGSDRTAVVALDRLRMSNTEQVQTTFDLLCLQAPVIEFFLLHLFPQYMRHQQLKISASAQELGSDMLFSRRIGFSGTPSSLIPRDLGECQFEPGSEASILETLSSPDTCGVWYENNSDWSARSILDYVATNSYHVLIDTGALVTGLSNFEVATYLMRNGLEARGIFGVVYLDEHDRKMVLLAQSLTSVKLEECGLHLGQRFAFYDQIHTTVSHICCTCQVSPPRCSSLRTSIVCTYIHACMHAFIHTYIHHRVWTSSIRQTRKRW